MLLREYVVGPERFDAAFRAFFDRWAYKHPKPADFFRTLEDVTGEDLDWFWRSWFYETDTADQAVASVTPGDTTRVTIEQRNELMLPVTVGLTYADGTTEQRRIPAEAFFTKDTYTLTLTSGRLQEVQLDPNQLLPDVNPNNESWTASDADDGAAASPGGQ
jgi:aminopeptidase N